MKIQGKTIEGVNQLEIVIPRGNKPEDTIVFTARAITDWNVFSALCPEPKPRVKILPGGKRELDTDAPTYKVDMEAHGTKRLAWIVLESLRATTGLEWDTVDPGKPDTWANFEEELKASGFSFMEIRRIIEGCLEVNALSDDKLDKARADFLSFREKQAALLSSLVDAPDSTPSGEPANASA